MTAASIEFSGHAIACFIRNRSETGAALELGRPINLPAQFTLLIAADRIKGA